MDLITQPRKTTGSLAITSIIKITISGIVVVLITLLFAQKLYPLTKSALNLAPSGCPTTGKTTQDYASLLQEALSAGRIPDIQRLYHEYKTCNPAEPIDPALHLQLGKAVYTHYLNTFSYKEAVTILTDYTLRQPPPPNREEAENLIKEAERLYKESPAGRLEALARLEHQHWPAAKQGYKKLLDDLSSRPATYRQAFAPQETAAHERYVRIETDQFRTLNIRFTPSDATINPSTGDVTFTIGFEGSTQPPYLLTLATTERSVEHPTAPLRITLTHQGTDRPLYPPTSQLDLEANNHLASALLERVSTIACSTSSTLACKHATVSAPLDTSGAPTPGPSLHSTPLPVPAPTMIAGPVMTFPVTPYLPTTHDPRSRDRYPSFEANAGGTTSIMDVIIESYPTPRATIAWKDTSRTPLPPLRSQALTKAALQTLCPRYTPPQPITRDMTGELIRCLASRQVFATPYTLWFEPLPSP